MTKMRKLWMRLGLSDVRPKGAWGPRNKLVSETPVRVEGDGCRRRLGVRERMRKDAALPTDIETKQASQLSRLRHVSLELTLRAGGEREKRRLSPQPLTRARMSGRCPGEVDGHQGMRGGRAVGKRSERGVEG
ncbi:hypothetical protein Tco_0673342 [Tanacetum coccineum]